MPERSMETLEQAEGRVGLKMVLPAGVRIGVRFRCCGVDLWAVFLPASCPACKKLYESS